MCWLKSYNVSVIVFGTVLGTQDTAVNKMDKISCLHVANSHSGGGGQIQ